LVTIRVATRNRISRRRAAAGWRIGTLDQRHLARRDTGERGLEAAALGPEVGEALLQSAIRSFADTVSAGRRTWKVFCHIFPKPKVETLLAPGSPGDLEARDAGRAEKKSDPPRGTAGRSREECCVM